MLLAGVCTLSILGSASLRFSSFDTLWVRELVHLDISWDRKLTGTIVETRGRTLEEMSRLFGIESRLAERVGIKPGEVNKTSVEEHVEDVGPSSS